MEHRNAEVKCCDESSLRARWNAGEGARAGRGGSVATRRFAGTGVFFCVACGEGTPSPRPQGIAGGVENHLLLRLSPPPLLPHINAHALIHTLHTSYLPLPLPPPHDQPYFCTLMNSLSIKRIVSSRSECIDGSDGGSDGQAILICVSVRKRALCTDSRIEGAGATLA